MYLRWEFASPTATVISISGHFKTVSLGPSSKSANHIGKHLLINSQSPRFFIISTGLIYGVVRLLHPRCGDNQSQETFLAPSTVNQTHSYDTEFSLHNPSLSTLRPKGLSCSKLKWWAMCTNLPVNVVVRLPYSHAKWSNLGQLRQKQIKYFSFQEKIFFLKKKIH